MAIVPLQIPPGAYRNGTEYQAKGRWRDVNLVRWHEGAMAAVQGLAKPANSPVGSVAITEGVRSGVAWTDNSGNHYVIFGNFDTVKVMEFAGTVTDLTPAGLSGGASVTDEEGIWQFATFGEIPIACNRDDGRIWEWDLNTANNLTQVTNSPTNCRGVFVTDERFVVALGDGGDPRSIRWSGREDRTVWTPAATNQAGDYQLDTEGEIQFALRMRDEWIIVTTRDVWRARYVGYPVVYEFARVGPCTVVGGVCGTTAGDVAYWMGDTKFYRYSGGVVESLPCPVSDYLFGGSGRHVSALRAWQTSAWHNHQFGEVWWLYPSGLTDVDSYVAVDVEEGHWHYGSWGGTAVVGQTQMDQNNRVVPLGFFGEDDLATNGGFDTDSDWVKGTNWQISGGVASQTSVTSSDLAQDISGLSPGVAYLITGTVASSTVGNLQVRFAGVVSGSFVTGNGERSVVLTAENTTETLSFSPSSGWDGTLDDVVVTVCPIMRVDYNNSAGHLSTPYAKTGPFEFGNGERRVHVTRLYPDEQDQGELKFTFGHREYPNATETTEAAVTASNPTDVRFSGRHFTMRVEGASANTQWRSGIHRLEIKPGGER